MTRYALDLTASRIAISQDYWFEYEQVKRSINEKGTCHVKVNFIFDIFTATTWNVLN